MKTAGEIESAVCTAIAWFEQECMGRGPKDTHTLLIGDMLIVRLKGVLTGAEQHLARTSPADRGHDLLKQVRPQQIETARPGLVAIVLEITGSRTFRVHHDISTRAGEETIVFVLTEASVMREAKRLQETGLTRHASDLWRRSTGWGAGAKGVPDLATGLDEL